MKDCVDYMDTTDIVTRSYKQFSSIIIFLVLIASACQYNTAEITENGSPVQTRTPITTSTATASVQHNKDLTANASPKTSDLEMDLSSDSPGREREEVLATQPPSTPTPSPTSDPYVAFGVKTLSERDYGGGLLEIVDTLEENETFKRYLITYPSDGLKIYGYIDVPVDGERFPVVIVLHGYISPDDYETVTYTERYTRALAEAGYFVIHPNLRNYPPSDSGPNPFRIGYAIDVLNLIAIVRDQSQDPRGYLRRADREDINIWGHSMGGGVALRVITVNNEPYLRSAVLYGSMSGNESVNFGRILTWSGGQNGEFELAASAESMASISPVNHLERINAAVSIHHSEDDNVVPFFWSVDLCNRLTELDGRTECHFYQGLPHTFRGYGDKVFIERVIDFFDRH